MVVGLLILSKLSTCSSDLFRWGYHRVHDFKAQIKDCKDILHKLRGKRDEASLNDFTETRDRYNELFHSHEVYWKQRSKAFWLWDGDSNSKFFHAMASTRRRTNNLAKLHNQEGQWCTEPEDVNALICRTISDNVLISAEIMHFFKRKRQGKEGIAALKIDMSKAYNWIEWGFLRSILLKLGFAVG